MGIGDQLGNQLHPLRGAMKRAWQCVFLPLWVCYAPSAVRAGYLRKDGGGQSVSSKMHTELKIMVSDMMEGKGPGVSLMAKTIHQKMDLPTAVRQLDGKLPNDVASLVHMATTEKNGAGLDEDSMQKARKILNNMMLKAWGELDDVIFECKEFQERNRGTYEQVVADLARLGSQLSRLGELRVSSNQGIFDKDGERRDAEERLEKETREYDKVNFENQREMTIRKNDLAVFDFILQASACKDNAFIQMNKPGVQVARQTMDLC